jgi:Zn-dependent protease with chaperone function
MREHSGRPGDGRPSTDFFGRQDDARRATRRMLVLFALAVVSVLVALVGALALGKYAFMHYFGLAYAGYAPWPATSTLAGIAVVATGAMAWVSWSRMRELDLGGAVVMEWIGAREIDPDTADPVHRRLIHIVQEMAIASSIPPPDVYLLAREDGINAFAAGHGTADAAICVTYGCLEKLTRDELQGVIAHEFSHIVHGDMRLNIRLIGLLAGVMFLATTGRSLIYGDFSCGKKDPTFYMLGQYSIGFILLCVGSIGHLAGRVLQAAVSRSREFLADAAAVQFTRQTLGIVGALRKIQALSAGSALHGFDSSEVAHMLFGEGGRWSRLLATHPAVPMRIRALGMPYREQDILRIANAWRTTEQAADVNARHASIAGLVPCAPATDGHAFASVRLAGTPRAVTPEAVVSNIGHATETAVQTASQLLPAVPGRLLDAAASPDDAPALILSLAVGIERAWRAIQLDGIEQHMGAATRTRVETLFDASARLAPMARLPLLQLALPRLRRLPRERGRTLLQVLDALVHADGRIDLYEFCLVRLVRLHLAEAAHPARARLAGPARLFDRRADFATLCAILAGRGGVDGDAARRIWRQAMDRALPGHGLTYAVPPAWQTALDGLLQRLDALRPIDKELAIEGLADAVLADRRVTVEESELLRLICACLHCPLPPFLAAGDDRHDDEGRPLPFAAGDTASTAREGSRECEPPHADSCFNQPSPPATTEVSP